ncbi:hypothetical protein ACUNG5_22250, partial [Serratia sp. IR-2025]
MTEVILIKTKAKLSVLFKKRRNKQGYLAGKCALKENGAGGGAAPGQDIRGKKSTRCTPGAAVEQPRAGALAR